MPETNETTDIVLRDGQLALPEVPDDWNYESSLEMVRPLVIKWKTLTIELMTELHVAREALSTPAWNKGSDGTNVPSQTWAQYCEDISLEKRTINRWLAQFFGAKRSPHLALPQFESQVLYADPPWEYANSGFDQSAAQQYPTMSIKDICDYTDPSGRKIKDIVGERSVLFLWVTYPLAPAGFEVINAWGFEYKAQMVWVKPSGPGIGWWVNSRHELLYIAGKGQELHPAVKYDSVFEAPRGRHSEKPDIVSEWIEQMYTGPYVELFARKRRDGWESWGNEL